jgi:hypothetical protein
MRYCKIIATSIEATNKAVPIQYPYDHHPALLICLKKYFKLMRADVVELSASAALAHSMHIPDIAASKSMKF